MKQCCNLAIFFWLAFGLSLHASPEILSLEDALDKALLKNPLQKAQALETRAVEQGIDRARASFFPQLDGSVSTVKTSVPGYAFMQKINMGDFAPSDFAPEAINNPDPVTSTRFALEIRQPIFTGGSRWMGLKAAHAEAGAAAAKERFSESALVFQVTEAYFAARFAEEQVVLDESALKACDALWLKTQKLFEAGLVLKSDALRAQVRHLGSESDLQQARHVSEVSLRRLATLIGEPNLEFQLTTSFPEPGEIPDIILMAGEVPENRADLQALRFHEESLRQRSRQALSAFLPSLSAFAGVEKNRKDFWGDGQNDVYAGVSLQWNLFRGGADRAVRRERVLKRQALEARLQALQDSASMEVYEAERGLLDATSQVRIARLAVDPAGEAYRILLKRYEEGLLGVDELLSAELEWRRSETRLSQSRYGYATARARLNFVTGVKQ